MEKIIWIISGSYILVMALIDLRKREIPVIPGIACIAGIFLLHIIGKNRWEEWLPGVSIGLVLWIVSKVSRGAVGEGDALAYMVLGTALGLSEVFEVLMISLFLAALTGSVLILCRRAGKCSHEGKGGLYSRSRFCHEYLYLDIGGYLLWRDVCA